MEKMRLSIAQGYIRTDSGRKTEINSFTGFMITASIGGATMTDIDTTRPQGRAMCSNFTILRQALLGKSDWIIWAACGRINCITR